MTARAVERAERDAAASLLLAVLAAVCGTLVAGAFDDTSPGARLLGAALGAALPPLMAVTGPYTHVRAAAGVVVAAVALLVTYGGFTVSDYASSSERTTFPVPQALQGDSGSTSSDDPSAGPSEPSWIETCEGERCIAVSHAALRCTEQGCDGPVVVRSTGGLPLEVWSIEFDGAAAADFAYGGTCGDAIVLLEDQQCTVEITHTPGPETAARLVIHQDLAGPATYIALERDPEVVSEIDGPDLLLEGPVECSVVPDGALSGADALTVFVAVRNGGPGEHEGSVTVSTALDDDERGRTNTGVSTGTARAPVPADLDQSDYAQSHELTVTVDPEGEVEESDETNNVLRLTLQLPQRPDGEKDVPCPPS